MAVSGGTLHCRFISQVHFRTTASAMLPGRFISSLSTVSQYKSTHLLKASHRVLCQVTVFDGLEFMLLVSKLTLISLHTIIGNLHCAYI